MDEEERKDEGWLPPEPPGPDPGLATPPLAGSGLPGQIPGQPQQQPTPPPQQPQPPPAQYPAQPPPPPGGWQQTQQQQQQQWPPPQTYARQAEPGNGAAIAALVLSLCGLGLLIVSVGLLFIITLPLAILGIVFGRKGRNAVDQGETPKNRGIAQAGYIIGIVTTVLSVLAAAGWIALLAADPNFLDELDETDSSSFDFSSAIRALGALARTAAALVG